MSAWMLCALTLMIMD
ncbi:rCG23045 [Rattus norvegicus]|uniref:RCG23045 n=1 Tax=Rattus norvegicus TaxID=10116 RepID=A6KTZ8_RAT|nr:rCG23045 [Rattus norvegicus]